MTEPFPPRSLCQEFGRTLVEEHPWLSLWKQRGNCQQLIVSLVLLCLLISKLLLVQLETWLALGGSPMQMNTAVVAVWINNVFILSCFLWVIRLAMRHFCTTPRRDYKDRDDVERKSNDYIVPFDGDDKETIPMTRLPPQRHLHGYDNEGFVDETASNTNGLDKFHNVRRALSFDSVSLSNKNNANSDVFTAQDTNKSRSTQTSEMELMNRAGGSVLFSPVPGEKRYRNTLKFMPCIQDGLPKTGRSQTRCLTHQQFAEVLHQLPGVRKHSSEEIVNSRGLSDVKNLKIDDIVHSADAQTMGVDGDNKTNSGTSARATFVNHPTASNNVPQAHSNDIATQTKHNDQDSKTIKPSLGQRRANVGPAGSALAQRWADDTLLSGELPTHTHDEKNLSDMQQRGTKHSKFTGEDLISDAWDKIILPYIGRPNAKDPFDRLETKLSDSPGDLNMINAFAQSFSRETIDFVCNRSTPGDEVPPVILEHGIMDFLEKILDQGAKMSPPAHINVIPKDTLHEELSEDIRRVAQCVITRQIKHLLQKYVADQNYGRPSPSRAINSSIPDIVPEKSRMTTSDANGGLYEFNHHPDKINTEPDLSKIAVCDSENIGTDKSHSDGYFTEVTSIPCVGREAINPDAHENKDHISGEETVYRKSSVDLLRRLSRSSVESGPVSDERLELTMRVSLGALTDPHLQLAIDKASAEAYDRQLRSFARRFAKDLCETAERTLMKEIIITDAGRQRLIPDHGDTHTLKQPLRHLLLSSGEEEVCHRAIPTLAQYVSQTVTRELQTSRDHRGDLKSSVLTAQFVDTLVTNALLRTEQLLEYSRDFLSDNFLWHTNNSNNADVLDEDKQRIMGCIMDHVYQQLNDRLMAHEGGPSIHMQLLQAQHQRIISRLSDLSSSEVGTHLIWHAVQRAHDKVEGISNTLDISQMALQRGWVRQLDDQFLVGGSKLQEHLAVIEMVSDHVTGKSLQEACAEVAEELIYFLCVGSVDDALDNSLQHLCSTVSELAEERSQEAQYHTLVNKSVDYTKSGTTNQRAPDKPSLWETVKNLIKEINRNGAAVDDITIPMTSSSSSCLTLTNKPSLAITNSDPYVKQVTSLEDSDTEPLLRRLPSNTIPPVSATYGAARRPDATARNPALQRHRRRAACCRGVVLGVMVVLIVSCVTASVTESLSLSSEEVSTWLTAVAVSVLIQALVLEPVWLFLKAQRVWFLRKKNKPY